MANMIELHSLQPQQLRAHGVHDMQMLIRSALTLTLRDLYRMEGAGAPTLGHTKIRWEVNGTLRVGFRLPTFWEGLGFFPTALN